MFKIFDKDFMTLLEQQDTKTMLLRKAISDRLPITINYTGPADEVKPGKRIDIQPVIMGKNIKSGNTVIWAFVTKGVSKKGLPNWKMFRVDRIKEVNINMGVQPFKLSDVPGFVKGKAPSAMKSLSSVDIMSPYWFEDDKRYTKSPITKQPPKPQPQQPTKPQQVQKTEPVKQPEPTEPTPVENPETSPKDYTNDIVNILSPKIKDMDGKKTITNIDYQNTIKDLYNKKESEWKNYQRQVGKNDRPGEGTRARFNNSSKSEIDAILSKDNIEISDNNEMLSEMYKIHIRFKQLINS
jgi:hypothetical protein